MSDDVLKKEKAENLEDRDKEQVNLEAVEDIAAQADGEETPAEPSLEEQLAETKDQLLRSLAEVENIRKRSQREKEEMAQYAVTGFARDLLSVADNLNRAVESLSASDQKEAKGLLEGVEITEKELLKVLEKHRIKKIESLDQPFDPNFHQAMVEIPSEDKEPGTVIQEMQIGYTIAGRLLRPALVGVAKK
ncbi:MAG: nucleotide exchange factor GrpE [Alphaproteobacteria bacterium]|nr:nucleotide exchange factor GrpE [Alphaproteobacteria bacterium]